MPRALILVVHDDLGLCLEEVWLLLVVHDALGLGLEEVGLLEVGGRLCVFPPRAPILVVLDAPRSRP